MNNTKGTINSSKWKVKATERSKGRMKIQIKMNKEEAEFFKVWTSAVKPEGVSDDDFYKRLLFKGIETIDGQLNELIQKTVTEMKHVEGASSIEVQGKDTLPNEDDVEEVE